VADLELVRVAVAPEGAFGVLLVDGVPAGPVTLERTYPIDELNPRGVQYVKIPAGQYPCVRTYFQRGHYETYEVTQVTGHTRLLFHCGNSEMDTEGCILVGQRFGKTLAWQQPQPGVLESRLAFGEFMRLAGGTETFTLTVRGIS
jgi:hypothetical protein